MQIKLLLAIKFSTDSNKKLSVCSKTISKNFVFKFIIVFAIEFIKNIFILNPNQFNVLNYICFYILHSDALDFYLEKYIWPTFSDITSEWYKVAQIAGFELGTL